MELNIIKCQTGFDYDIFGLSQNMIIQTIFNLNILINSQNRQNIYIGFSSIDNLNITKGSFNKSFEPLNIKLECEDNLLILNYNRKNLKYFFSIIPEEELYIIQHIYLFNNQKTIFEWIDIFCDSQASISNNINLKNIKDFTTSLHCTYKLYKDK